MENIEDSNSFSAITYQIQASQWADKKKPHISRKRIRLLYWEYLKQQFSYSQKSFFSWFSEIYIENNKMFIHQELLAQTNQSFWIYWTFQNITFQLWKQVLPTSVILSTLASGLIHTIP